LVVIWYKGVFFQWVRILFCWQLAHPVMGAVRATLTRTITDTKKISKSLDWTSYVAGSKAQDYKL